MSKEEVGRSGVLARVKADEITQVEAAEILGLSYRQTKRLYSRYGKLGIKGLVHGNAGRGGNRGKPRKLRERVLKLVKKHYGGEPGERFGPTLAVEHLEEDHGVVVDAETLWRWMLAEGCGRGSGSGSGSGKRTGSAGCAGGFWRTGADGWELRELAGTAGAAGVFDSHGG